MLCGSLAFDDCRVPCNMRNAIILTGAKWRAGVQTGGTRYGQPAPCRGAARWRVWLLLSFCYSISNQKLDDLFDSSKSYACSRSMACLDSIYGLVLVVTFAFFAAPCLGLLNLFAA